MVKLALTAESGRHMMAFGLSKTNVQRMKEGKPIAFDAKEAGLPFDGHIMIFYGTSEHDMLEEISHFIGPETKVSIDPRSL